MIELGYLKKYCWMSILQNVGSWLPVIQGQMIKNADTNCTNSVLSFIFMYLYRAIKASLGENVNSCALSSDNFLSNLKNHIKK